MPFFSGAQDVKIFGGSFSETHGDSYTWIDQSRNVNSNNIGSTIVTDSYNDNGYGSGYQARRMPPPPGAARGYPGARRPPPPPNSGWSEPSNSGGWSEASDQWSDPPYDDGYYPPRSNPPPRSYTSPPRQQPQQRQSGYPSRQGTRQQPPQQRWPEYEYEDEPMEIDPDPRVRSAPPRQQYQQQRSTTMESDFDSIYGSEDPYYPNQNRSPALGGYPKSQSQYQAQAQLQARRTPVHSQTWDSEEPSSEVGARGQNRHPVQQSSYASEPALGQTSPRGGPAKNKNPFARFLGADAGGADGGGSQSGQSSLSGRMNNLNIGSDVAREARVAFATTPQFFSPPSSNTASSGAGSSMYTEGFPRPGRSPVPGGGPGQGEDETLDDQTAQAIMFSIMEVINQKDSYRKLLHVEKWRAQRLVDISQAVLESPSIDPMSRRELVVAMQRFSKSSSVYPRSYRLEGVRVTSRTSMSEGAFGKVYKGSYQGKTVCLKALKEDGRTGSGVLIKALAREAILWRQLTHENILPFYGICELEVGLCLVSPWMLAGHLKDHVKGPVSAEDRLLIARDIAKGLAYLHLHNVVHGDLKGTNVLIDGVGRARIADFGLTSVNDPEIAYWTSQAQATSKGGTAAYQAPEILAPAEDDADDRNTYASDVYAWGITCYELYTGDPPYTGRKETITLQKLRDELPARPNAQVWTHRGLTEKMWALMSESWSTNPDLRPTAKEVVERLDEMIDEDHRPASEDAEGGEGEPEGRFLSRWCRNSTGDERTPGGRREQFQIPTVREVEDLLKLP